jgi:hypothetical protein
MNDNDKKISVSRESLKNLKPFKKGESGNPSGRPSNKGLKNSLNRLGNMSNPKPQEVDPLDMGMEFEKYTPKWDRRTKREKVLESIWDKAIEGDMRFIEYLAKLGCLDTWDT